MSNVAAASPSKTGEISGTASGGESAHALKASTTIVVAGASGDLAKKKVR